MSEYESLLIYRHSPPKQAPPPSSTLAGPICATPPPFPSSQALAAVGPRQPVRLAASIPPALWRTKNAAIQETEVPSG